MTTLIRRMRSLRAGGAVALALVVLAGCAATTAQPDVAAAAGPSTASVTTDTKQPVKCIHGCERWGKRCNIDPRGVYKCQRVCEKFGEICE